ncbi:MAG: carboxylesterase family protein [Alphaproteobacteria bacterium]|nr:carboxylesterase family protein [Alphaproteobacteria bacterium]
MSASEAQRQAFAQPASNGPVVKTVLGEVQGFTNGQTGQICFWGLPYAEPPVGELRFKSTMPKKPWQGVLQATAFGASGPQVFDVTEGSYEEFTGHKTPPNNNPWIGSEDNLTLNIWTPALDGSKRPVMVWIHGGANWLESSRLHTYHGDNFVNNGDVVFVSLNYRLGIFGWLDVSVLGGEEYKGSHSNGLKDQLCALQWIKENIEAFGGDASNITVMGESAGSIDLSWLLTNGHLNGIAKRVVLMSGIAGLIGLSGDLGHGFTEAFAQEQAKTFLDKMGINSMAQLQSSTTDELMARVSHINQTEPTLTVMDSQFWPRMSDDFTPLDPFRAAEKYGSHGIDVIVGYTAYEMGLWLFWDETLDTHPFSWSAAQLGYPQDTQTLETAQAAYAPMGDPEGVQGMNLIGDSIFVIPSYWFADILARKGETVRLFQFDWQADSRRKALHAADQAFLFGKLETHAAQHLLGPAADTNEKTKRVRLSTAMMESILGYAKNGAPAQDSKKTLPVWPVYNAETRPVMSFNYDSQIVDDPARLRREWWYNNIYQPALAEKE